MKGFTATIRMVIVVAVTFLTAVLVLGVGFTGTIGDIFSNGTNNVESRGCDFQRNQFFQGNADFETLDERCISEEDENLQISMRTAQENLEVIKCMNDYVEENGGSNGITGIEC